MDEEQINALAADLTRCLQWANEVNSERRLLLRVLAQAVLTHGGTLTVDPSLSRQAEACASRVLIGDGKVMLRKE